MIITSILKLNNIIISSISSAVKPKLFVSRRVVHASIGQEIVIECLSESYPNSGNLPRASLVKKNKSLLTIN